MAEFALDTFGDVTQGPDGTPLAQAGVIRNLVEEAVLADELGIDFFGVGEHHREDFAISAPEVVLAAIAARTTRIRLGSAVTVLSSDDPIRVFQRFSTLDAVSSGRAEVILGRGSFTESFPLFGFELDQYETLFEEKLDLFAAVRSGEPVTWEGTTRAPLADQRVFPPVEHGLLRTWVGVGGSPKSVIRAARYGLPMMLAIIGGDPARFRPYVDLYHQALAQFGIETQPVGVHSTATSPRPTPRRGRNSGRTGRPRATASGQSAAGRRPARRTSSGRSRAARSISAHPRQWRGGSPPPWARSASPASR